MRPEADDNAAHIADMLRYAREVAKRVKSSTFEEFLSNSDVRLATERRIEIIGEAARRVSEDFRADHPHIPWRPIIAQ